MVWHELFPTHKCGCRNMDRSLKISAKNAVFIISSGKKKFHHLWPPAEKRLEISTSVPPAKMPSDAHAHKHAKWHHFCEKFCCLTPSGNTVQQHQRGKQSIAGWQTVHSVFCQTISKSCQITNNMFETISKKYCQNSATFFFSERFTLSLDPIQIVLLKLTIFRQKSGVARPPQK